MDKTVKETPEAVDAELRDPRVYEVGYLLVPQIKDEDLDKEIDAVRNIITGKGGLPISEGRAELMELAYPMTTIVNNERNTYAKGYFGWIKFDVSPEKITDIKAGFDATGTIIRFMIMSTVKEDTMISSKVMGKFPKDERSDRSGRPERQERPSATHTPKAPEKPAEPINEEQLDKQIDDLVVPE